jgi:hypothetical protein
MKPQGLFRCCAAALLLFASVAAADAAPTDHVHVQALTEASARDVAALIAQPGFADAVTGALADHPDQGVPLARILARFDPQGRTQAARTFAAKDRQLRLRKGLPAAGANLLQVRAYVPKGRTLADIPAAQLWVAVLPRGDDRQWTTLTAYDRQGRSHVLDARVAPAFPVLIVDIDTRKAVEEGMAVVNAGLRARGLQSADRIAVAADGSASLDLTRLDRIRLNDDQEPWALGDAEVFAVVSGLQIGAAAPEMATVTLPWLDDDNTDYTPGQPLVIWGNYRFDAANVQLFEDDGDTNYQDLLVALTDGVKAALGVFVPEYAIVADIAGAILKAMPATWFANDTDYLDSFYLLQRGQGYVDRMGAANNAKVTLSPVTLTE